MDNLSIQHFRTVQAEMEGRFFSQEEAAQLKEAIDRHTVTDPQIRALAAQSWPTPPAPQGQWVMLRPEIAAMKQRLAESELIKEAEALGFGFDITLPKDCLVPLDPPPP